ncbi:MAG: 3-phosphoshikimate 1-carboxyvinyltransferase [Chlamydiota bacterium]
MKTLFTQRSQGKGDLTLPPSKSHTQRALFFALMGRGVSTIQNYLPSPDIRAMLQAIQEFGAKVIFQDEKTISILGCAGKLESAQNVIDAGNSGQVLRFIGALASLLPTYTVITGDLSIRHNRPVKPLLEGIRQLGGFAESMQLNDTAPILLRGPIKAGKVFIDGECSQPVSGLLMACSFLPSPTEIIVHNGKEKPWIRLTLAWMDRLGLTYKEDNLEKFTVYGKGQYDGFTVNIQGDMSSAAFPVAAALITKSELCLYNVDRGGSQGDEKVFDDLISMGAHITFCPLKNTLTVKNTGELLGGTLDVNDCIDAVPILSVLGCFCKNPLILINGKAARKKESDRIHCMAIELTKMGAHIEEKEDSLVIFPSILKGTKLSSHKDHRVAMSLAVAGLGASDITEIEDVDCIEKSYPLFINEMQRLGFLVTEK